jgi:hypothetical protein
VLAGLLGVAGVVLGRAGLRQIRRVAGWAAVTGRGLAIAGIACGAVGFVLTAAAFVGSFVLVAGQE